MGVAFERCDEVGFAVKFGRVVSVDPKIAGDLHSMTIFLITSAIARRRNSGEYIYRSARTRVSERQPISHEIEAVSNPGWVSLPLVWLVCCGRGCWLRARSAGFAAATGGCRS